MPRRVDVIAGIENVPRNGRSIGVEARRRDDRSDLLQHGPFRRHRLAVRPPRPASWHRTRPETLPYTLSAILKLRDVPAGLSRVEVAREIRTVR